VVFDIKPHLSGQDELDLHAEAHRDRPKPALIVRGGGPHG
jgi:hypothetical protein